MIPRNDGESLLSYLDRLTLMASERASLQVRLDGLAQELATATMADEQLRRYSALIETDMFASMSGIEISKPEAEISASTVIPLRESACSEFNGGSNSAQNDHAAQAQGHAAQAETLSGTPENAPAISLNEPANSETNSEPAVQDEREFAPDSERTRQWALGQTGEITASAASLALDILEKSAAKYLSQLVALSVLTRVDGTGKPGIPSRYRVPGAVSAAPCGDLNPEEEAEEPVHLDRSRLPVDQRLLLEHLEKHGAMTPKLAASQLNWANSRIDRASAALLSGGLLGWRGPTLVAIPDELLTELPAAD